MSTELIGTVHCDVNRDDWDVFSDGKAYGGCGHVAYRWPDRTWRTLLVPPDKKRPEAQVWPVSERCEALFFDYLAGIIVGPIDPHRHLK